MSAQQFHAEVMAQREVLEARFYAGEFDQRFVRWICENYAPISGEPAFELMRDSNVIDKFLRSTE
jgi:hypothetical protein